MDLSHFLELQGKLTSPKKSWEFQDRFDIQLEKRLSPDTSI
jgi:hypothetical protein